MTTLTAKLFDSITLVQFAHSRLADPCDKKVKKSVKEKISEIKIRNFSYASFYSVRKKVWRKERSKEKLKILIMKRK